MYSSLETLRTQTQNSRATSIVTLRSSCASQKSPGQLRPSYTGYKVDKSKYLDIHIYALTRAFILLSPSSNDIV